MRGSSQNVRADDISIGETGTLTGWTDRLEVTLSVLKSA